MRRALAAALGALVLMAVPAAAQTPVTETAELGSVRAEFSYTDNGDDQPTGLTLRIYDNGNLRLTDAIPDSEFLSPGGFGDPSVHVADLEGSAPKVLLDLYTGGAHCCLRTRIYFGTEHVDKEWGDVGYRLRDVNGDGPVEFVSADPAFSGAFSAYAYSRFPLQVWQFKDIELRDITRRPAVEGLLRGDAAKQKSDYKTSLGRFTRHRRNIGYRDTVKAALAAYTADECSLGRCKAGFALVDAARARKAVPKTFKKDLTRLLRRLRYLR